jgi:antirestriction protein ArdC
MLLLENTEHEKERQNSIAYLKSWYSVTNDPKAVISSFGKAEKARELIIK